MQRPYDIICFAARVLDNPRASWPDILEVIEKTAGHISIPSLKVLKKAYREFRRAPRSRASGF